MSLHNLIKTESGQYFDKYAYLNSIRLSDYTDDVLLKLQLQRLRQLENISPKLQQANAFMEQMNAIVPADISNGAVQETSLNQIAARIIEILNSALWGSSNSISKNFLEKTSANQRGWSYKKGKGKADIDQAIEESARELEILLDAIKYPKGAADKLVHGFKLGARGKKINGQNYKQFKADQAEELMMQLIYQNAGFISLVTGSFYNEAKQLIEDGFSFDSNVDLKFDSKMRFTLTHKKTKESKTVYVKSINELFDKVAKASGTYTVHLDNDLYAKLKELSVMRAQSKSGYGIQALINETKNRGAIALEDTQLHSALVDLYYLYELDLQEGTDYFPSGKESKTLEALANYSLSKSIQKTTLMSNDIYFTKDGFITASKWMETYNHLLKFKPGISKMARGMLTTPKTYSLVVAQ